MNVTLGVAVDKATARIALLDAAPPHAVIDQSQIDLADQGADTLVSTLVSTDRMLTESGHRLVRTTVCSPDPDRVTAVVEALAGAGLADVSAVSNSGAVTAATKALVGEATTAALVSDGETAALSIVDVEADATALIAVEQVVDGDRNAAFRALLERFSEEPGGATSVVLLGASGDGAETDALRQVSPVPLHLPEGHEYAVARGAALAGLHASPAGGPVAQGDSLNAAETVMSPQAQQLAYSEVDEAEDCAVDSAVVPMQTPMQPLSAVDPDEVEFEEGDAPAGRPRVLLLGSAVAALVVVGFAALAVSVAIGIRPAVSSQAVRLTDESLAGKYFPVAPGQGTTPDPPAWTAIEELPAPGEVPDARTLRPKLMSSTRSIGDAGAQTIKYYSDGTIGVQNTVERLAGGGVPGPGAVAQAPEYLTRLIPDFSRWSPCQVLAFVSNMRLMGQAAAGTVTPFSNAAAETLSGAAETTFGGISDLSDVGEIALVPQDKGPLFSTTKKVADGVPDTDAIPMQIFESGTTELASTKVADVLPVDSKIVDTKVLESLPTTGGTEKTTPVTILTEALTPDVVQSLPGTEGSAPIFKPEVPLPETSPGTDLTIDVPEGTLPGIDVGDKSLPLDIPGLKPGGTQPEAPSKVELPIIDSPSKPVFEAPKPVVDLPKPAIDLPKPAIDLPKPVIEAPSRPIIDLPKPVLDLPKPVIEAPAPVEVPVPAPAPKFELPSLPKLPIPAPAAPAPVEVPSAPVLPPAPAIPSIPIPTLPDLKLPFGGSLFGNG
ncbi:hypothetical protein [Mycolicibacterium confluentis]|uniref:DUF7159 domain-containing protein n=1 Tax=Mycolicibacterium confluentis TaxID=28047 RepID=A0A7I7Y4Q3_9MYCO|nr:hypothetical protein [Mycolicibacterium confluentis]MCV7322911.1 hypothetical protein [Mycolicibacterium confluentis]ORV20672.1 hypothetical protein AWB99_06890 [Mycolicibacterium confluentis]BBZ35911.1 hypothetical protein MCNF_45160 [Mycolicibacterium confluentis]